MPYIRDAKRFKGPAAGFPVVIPDGVFPAGTTVAKQPDGSLVASFPANFDRGGGFYQIAGTSDVEALAATVAASLTHE